ncbi:MAG: RES domain-containing protein [Mycobacterium sp.]
MSYEAPLTTSLGTVQCTHLDAKVVHRVGYKPQPWNWTPWEYAQDGRFDGRWDDPEGVWRMLYLGSTELACYLEVLAPFRPDAALADEMSEIVDDDEDVEYPTVPPGALSYDWCKPRLICTAILAGCFAVPGHHESLSTLRKQFLAVARRYGCHDLDASAIRDGERALTQKISSWIRAQTTADGLPADGIEYQSRHGDYLTLWAIYERDGGMASPPQITRHRARPIVPDDSSLIEALRIHQIEWSD